MSYLKTVKVSIYSWRGQAEKPIAQERIQGETTSLTYCKLLLLFGWVKSLSSLVYQMKLVKNLNHFEIAEGDD